jgi:hypothetical protein
MGLCTSLILYLEYPVRLEYLYSWNTLYSWNRFSWYRDLVHVI